MCTLNHSLTAVRKELSCHEKLKAKRQQIRTYYKAMQVSPVVSFHVNCRSYFTLISSDPSNNYSRPTEQSKSNQSMQIQPSKERHPLKVTSA